MNFNYEEAWFVLKDFPKFHSHERVSSRKRANPQEDYEPVNLDDEDDTSNPNQNPILDRMQNLFFDDPLRHPPGRNNSRKSQRSSGSSDASSGRYSGEEVREHVIESVRIQQQSMATIAEEVKKQTMLADKRTIFKAFKFLAIPIPTNLPPGDLEMINEARAQIKREYGLRLRKRLPPPPDNDESDD